MSAVLFAELDELLKKRTKGQPETRMGLDDSRSVADWGAALDAIMVDVPDDAEPPRDVVMRAVAELLSWVETIDRR